MKIAVEGCMHGDLDKVYETIKYIENTRNIKIDLLLCCGDFQAVRNEKDMECLSVPPKYREMKSFWKYYAGQEVAPVPTIFIGGNHEASNYLWELYYGGWAAPNIYFLGFSGVVKFGNIRIGGLSGIYNARHYHLGHFERPPYNDSTIRSVYHVREYDVHKLMQVEEPIDIFLSHDWPLGITDYGNWKELVRHKKHFKDEIQQGTLGSKAAAQLLEKLKPSYWFSAHLHCKFTALVQHEEGGPMTKFLALDKCLPGRKFLQIVDIESDPGPFEVQYDEEWLAITRKFNCVLPLTNQRGNFGNTQLDMQDFRQWVRSRLEDRGAKPCEFSQTAPPYNRSHPVSNTTFLGHPRNPQTVSFLEFLDLPYVLDNALESRDFPASLTQKGDNILLVGSIDDYSEDIPIEDEDELEDVAEADNENQRKENKNQPDRCPLLLQLLLLYFIFHNNELLLRCFITHGRYLSKKSRQPISNGYE
ncbi:lariat debranching enzyme isoform X4 [Durio zibethinus]|uniref:Lariat debranching enzyme isoform X4 n=1 Tax=Durio zibethinus TaxID=66656 RepID=A0A6P5XSS7_DURZI|nr:lariat debranching enzyme isoform X4 [Durio zibethinus]